jgi:glucoamylase
MNGTIANDPTKPDGHAPGHPGIEPTWTSSAKDMVGCSLGSSRIWFTLGFGIVNEVYYPRVDTPQIRDLGFIVADGHGFWVEVKRLENYTVRLLAPGTPAVEIVHKHDRFELTLRIVPNYDLDALAIELNLTGDPGLTPYVLLAPHLGATGYDNVAEITEIAGRCILASEQGGVGLALAAVDGAQRDAFGAASAGYVGVSDGWQDFNRNAALTWSYHTAGPGNVALIAGLPRTAVLALGFGNGKQSAATLAIATLAQPFDNLLKRQIETWQQWHAHRNERSLMRFDESDALIDQLVLSSMVLRAHRDKTYPGTMVASLSVPWGNSNNGQGGYHLIWPRDLVQCAQALLALGAEHEARNSLRYLIATQNRDGSWAQNQWLGGTSYWTGQQLDEAGFPVLLAAALAERNALDGIVVDDMIRRALSFIASTGPSSPQDRWEENSGVGPYTLGVCIAALVSGAEFLTEPAKSFALGLADFWNAHLETWMVVRDTPLAKRLGVDSYYIRMAPLDVLRSEQSVHEAMQIKNRADGGLVPADEEVSIDFLQLVRLGLRNADDPAIRNTIAVTDALLKAETPNGPAWHRYNGDGYGEHEDGSPFDGTGTGRAWPLLTGERGHYELVAGRDPRLYLRAMGAMAGPGGLIPEQVWDGTAIPTKRLYPGRPTGSAMPLAWAHAEFIKLMVSCQLGYPFDRPTALWKRYEGLRPKEKSAIWCAHAPIGRIGRGIDLVIALPRPANIHWGVDGWQNAADATTEDTDLGLYALKLRAESIEHAHTIDFTFQWLDSGRWAGEEFRIDVS